MFGFVIVASVATIVKVLDLHKSVIRSLIFFNIKYEYNITLSKL